MKDTGDFSREFLGRPRPAQPSPGPWTVRERRERSRFTDRIETTWIVLDANGKCVAECEHQIDAFHIAQNGPQPAEPTAPTGKGGKR